MLAAAVVVMAACDPAAKPAPRVAVSDVDGARMQERLATTKHDFEGSDRVDSEFVHSQMWAVGERGVVACLRYGERSPSFSFALGDQVLIEVHRTHGETHDATKMLEALLSKSAVDTLNEKSVRGYFKDEGFRVEFADSDAEAGTLDLDLEFEDTEVMVHLVRRLDGLWIHDDRALLEISVGSKRENEKLADVLLAP